MKQLIAKHHILDISHLKGYSQQIAFKIGNNKKTYDASQWNPLLLTISSKHTTLVKMLLHQIPCLHRLNCLSKPYSYEQQRQTAFDHSRRLKRECFGLKLSILNQDESMFKFLWNDLRLYWNLAHFFICLRTIIKTSWDMGLKILLASTTSKVIFMSVNTYSNDFVNVVDLFLIHLRQYDNMNPEFAKKVREGLFARPYFLYAYFIVLANQSKMPGVGILQKCLKHMSIDDLQLTHFEISDIFDSYASDQDHQEEQKLKNEQKIRRKSLILSLKTQFLNKFENRDNEIATLRGQIKRVLEQDPNTISKDSLSQSLLDLLDELDLFAFCDLEIEGVGTTNVFIEALKRGLEPVVDYAFNDGYINIRCLLKKNNVFEIENEISQINVIFFKYHYGNIKFLKKLYFYLIDYLQLSSFLEILITLVSDCQNEEQIKVISEFIMSDLRFKSLFQTSLEFQKYIFTKELLRVANAIGQTSLFRPFLLQDPFKKYLIQVEQGNYGEEYSKMTMIQLKKLSQSKENREQAVKLKPVIIKGRELGLENKMESPSQNLSPIQLEAESKTKIQEPVKTLKLQLHQIEQFEESLGNPNGIKTTEKEVAVRVTEEVIGSQIKKVETSQCFASTENNKNASNLLQNGITNDQKDEKLKEKIEHERESHQQEEIKEPIIQQVKTVIQESQLSNDAIVKAEPLQAKAMKVPEEFDQDSEEEENDQVSPVLHKRVPQTTNQIKSQFKKEEECEAEDNSNVKIHQVLNLNFQNTVSQAQPQKLKVHERLFGEIVKCIQDGKTDQLKIVLKKYCIRNVANLRNLEAINGLIQQQNQWMLQKHGRDFDSYSSACGSPINERQKSSKHKRQQRYKPRANVTHYDTSMWNPVLFAIYYQKCDILQLLLEQYVANIIMAIRMPPPSDYLEYITPNSQGLQLMWGATGSQYFNNDENRRLNQFNSVQRLGTNSDQSPQGSSPLRGNPSILIGNIGNPSQVTNQLRVKHHGKYNNNQDTVIEEQLYGEDNDEIDDDVLNDSVDRVIQLQQTSSHHHFYNPSDARVECFGIELAIRSRDISIFKYLWNDFNSIWDERHFAYIYGKMLQEHWDVGLGMLFRSKTSHVIYRSLAPMDRDNFLFSKIVDKITDVEFWEHEAVSPIKTSEKQVQIVISELSYDPYGSYAVLRFPQLFHNFGLLETTLKKVQIEDICDFIIARKENLQHFSAFVEFFAGNDAEETHYWKSKDRDVKVSHEKILQSLQILQKRAQAASLNIKQLRDQSKSSDLKVLENIISIIKLGAGNNANMLAKYFEEVEEGGALMLERLHLLTGYEDKDYLKVFQSNVKYIPTDEIMRLLLTDSTTTQDWNPLTFAIFYQRPTIVEYFCKNSENLVYLRSCMVKPFQLEAYEDEMIEGCENLPGGAHNTNDDEKFIQEKTELFTLVMCVMLNNRDIFRYLLRRCAFLWNDVHLALLTNFVLEAQWIDGLKVLLTSPCTHQIFNQMNLFEKEKYLKFCDNSVSRSQLLSVKMQQSGKISLQKEINNTTVVGVKQSLLMEFRYLMSFEPYNSFYLPLLATTEDLQFWDSSGETEESASKELFFKTLLLNFDEKAFLILSKYNSHYINEFISINTGNPNLSQNLSNFATKLRRYLLSQSN